MSGDIHISGFGGTCWCGTDHGAVAWREAYEAGRASAFSTDPNGLDASWGAFSEATLDSTWQIVSLRLVRWTRGNPYWEAIARDSSGAFISGTGSDEVAAIRDLTRRVKFLLADHVHVFIDRIGPDGTSVTNDPVCRECGMHPE